MSMTQTRRRTLRERNREARAAALVDAAGRIVALEGEEGLTMQRLAEDLECGVGSIYRYFPSKADLVEAVRANRLSDLSEALLLGRVALDEELRRRSMVASPVAALVRVIHAGRLWIDVCRARGSPADLVRSLLNTCTSQDERILGVVADPLGQVLDAAGAAGALEPGDTARRSAVLLAVLEDSNRLGPRDDGLANRLMGCLLVAWGADPDHLAAADSLLQGVDAEGIGNA